MRNIINWEAISSRIISCIPLFTLFVIAVIASFRFGFVFGVENELLKSYQASNKLQQCHEIIYGSK